MIAGLFYTIFINLTVASGTMVRNRNVTVYGFDGDPTGSDAEDYSQITKREFIGPSLSGNIGDLLTAPTYKCESISGTSPGGAGGNNTADTPTLLAPEGGTMFVASTRSLTGLGDQVFQVESRCVVQ